MSSEKPDLAEAKAVGNAEGNMCGAARRGAVALPESKTTSRWNGTRRNLGDLWPPTTTLVAAGLGGKPDRAKPRRQAGGVGRLHSTEEASNKAGRGSAAETVEGRRPVEGKASRDACPGHRAGTGMSLKRQACGPRLQGHRGFQPWSRSTFDRSPVRESRTPGSVRGAGRKARPYRVPWIVGEPAKLAWFGPVGAECLGQGRLELLQAVEDSVGERGA